MKETTKIKHEKAVSALVAKYKADGVPMEEIPIDGLFPKRVEKTLQYCNISNLGHIIEKEIRIGEVGTAIIKDVFLRFGHDYMSHDMATIVAGIKKLPTIQRGPMAKALLNVLCKYGQSGKEATVFREELWEALSKL